jgi:hypothetical protein
MSQTLLDGFFFTTFNPLATFPHLVDQSHSKAMT